MEYIKIPKEQYECLGRHLAEVQKLFLSLVVDAGETGIPPKTAKQKLNEQMDALLMKKGKAGKPKF